MMRHLAPTLVKLFLASIAALLAMPDPPKQPEHAFDQVTDVTGLPRVLLLGDFVSVRYTVPVRKELEGEANVHRPIDFSSSTTEALVALDGWLGEKPWDVIHFNWGLEDMEYLIEGDQELKDLDSGKLEQRVSVEQYEENLTQIVQRLKQTGAKLIWCTTTPVPKDASSHLSEDVLTYNTAALRVMQRHQVQVNDLYAFTDKNLDSRFRHKSVHFFPHESRLQGKQVATAIRESFQGE